jgi:hypothetical protein
MCWCCGKPCNKNSLGTEEAENQLAVEHARAIPRRPSSRIIYPYTTYVNNNNNTSPVYNIPLERFEHSKFNENDKKFHDDLPTYENIVYTKF